jgi:hypothetical protein
MPFSILKNLKSSDTAIATFFSFPGYNLENLISSDFFPERLSCLTQLDRLSHNFTCSLRASNLAKETCPDSREPSRHASRQSREFMQRACPAQA